MAIRILPHQPFTGWNGHSIKDCSISVSAMQILLNGCPQSQMVKTLKDKITSYHPCLLITNPLFQLFCQTMQKAYHLRPLKDDQLSFFEQALFITERIHTTPNESIKDILLLLATLPTEKREEILSCCTDLYVGGKGGIQLLQELISLGSSSLKTCMLARKIFSGRVDYYGSSYRLVLPATAEGSTVSYIPHELRHLGSVIHLPYDFDAINILRRLNSFPEEQREEIVNLTFDFRYTDGEHLPQLLREIGSIPSSQRGEILSLTSKIFRAGHAHTNFPSFLKQIAPTLLKLPQTERAELIECYILIASPICVNNYFVSSKEIFHQVEILANLPQAQRKEVAKLAHSCRSAYPAIYHMAALLAFLSSTPEEHRESIAEIFKQPISSHAKQNTLKILEYLPPNPHVVSTVLEIASNRTPQTSEFELFNQIFQSYPALAPPIHAHIFDRLLREMPNPEKSSAWARRIFDHAQELHISTTSPEYAYLHVVIEAANNRSNPKNPYAVYAKAKKYSEVLTPSVKRTQQRYGDSLYTLLPGKELPIYQHQIPVNALPQGIDRSTVEDLFAAFERRIQASLEHERLLSHIQDTTGFSFISHKNNLTRCPYLRSLFPLANETHISFHGSCYIAIVKHLIDLPDDISAGDLLSSREKRLLEISCWIRNCPARQSEAISLLYGSLPVSYQYTPATQDSSEALHVKSFLTNTIHKVFLEILSSDDSYLRKLTKVRSHEEIAQLSHQSVFVKNCLAPHIGLQHTLSFDLSTETLYPALQEQSLSSMLSLFYKHVSLSMLTSPLLEAVNTTNVEEHEEWYRRCIKVLDPIDAEELDKVWDLSDDDSTFSLTQYGALEILRKAGFLSKENLPWWQSIFNRRHV